MSEELALPEPDDIEIIEVDDTPEEDRRPVRSDVEPFNIDEEIDVQDERVKKRLNRLKYEYHQISQGDDLLLEYRLPQ